MNNAKKLIGIVLMIAVVLVGGQSLFASGAPEKGFGETVEMSFDNTGFDTVMVSGIDNYEIILGDAYGVSVAADESLASMIEVSQNGSALSVSLPEAYKYDADTLSAVIELPALDALTVAAKSAGTISGNAAKAVINVTDGSALAMEGFSINDALVEVSVDSYLSGSIDADRLDMRVYSSAVELSGDAEIMSCFADAASLEMSDLYINTALLDLNNESAGTVELKASETVDVQAYTEVRLHDDSTLTLDAEGSVNDDEIEDDDSALSYI